jgi:hypothetical protein
MARLCIRALGSLFVASYDLQSYGACILTALHTEYILKSRGRTLLQHRHAATASWLKEKQHIPPSTVAVVMRKKSCGRSSKENQKTTTGRVFSSNFTTPAESFETMLRGTLDQNKRNTLRHEEVPGTNEHERTKREQQHETDHSVRAPTVSSLPLNNMLKVASIVQQSMTEFSNAEAEEAGTIATAKLVLYITNQSGH